MSFKSFVCAVENGSYYYCRSEFHSIMNNIEKRKRKSFRDAGEMFTSIP